VFDAATSHTIIWKRSKLPTQQNRDKAEVSQSRYGFSKITSFGSKRKSRMLQAIIRSLLPQMNESAVLVEAGPGRGEFAELILQQGYDYVGIV
jgi:hypothetical protein